MWSTCYCTAMCPLYHRQQRLQFRPPLEEVKAKYYREMKKFLCIPFHFNGVSDRPVAGERESSAGRVSSIFTAMVDHNAMAFATVYSKAQTLFQQLETVTERFCDWIVLGQVDLELLVDEHLESVQDWERNFRALKAKGREAEKLPKYVTLLVSERSDMWK